jgi:cytochrome c oxidase subunit 2
MNALHSKRTALALVILGGVVLSGCQLPTFGAYRGETSQGQDAFKLYQGFFITGIFVFLLVFVLIIWSVLRYRRRGDEVPRQVQYHTVFEIFYTVVPLIMVLVLFAFTVITENEVTAIPPGKVDITVTGFQWGWRFYYPQTGKTVIGETTETPQMVVPTGQSVAITLVSADVIHGFYVPEFNYSEYALPGVTNRFNFTVLRSGTYRGQCTQLCGLYHSLMFFSVRSVSPGQFQAWVHTGVGTTHPTISKEKAQIAANGPGE